MPISLALSKISRSSNPGCRNSRLVDQPALTSIPCRGGQGRTSIHFRSSLIPDVIGACRKPCTLPSSHGRARLADPALIEGKTTIPTSRTSAVSEYVVMAMSRDSMSPIRNEAARPIPEREPHQQPNCEYQLRHSRVQRLIAKRVPINDKKGLAALTPPVVLTACPPPPHGGPWGPTLPAVVVCFELR
jgi:hypothetical protein